MRNLSEIVYESLKSTSSTPSWWILAFCQAYCLFFLTESYKYNNFSFKSIFFFIFIFAVLQLVLAFLWLEIKAKYEKQIENMATKYLVKRLMVSAKISGVVVVALWILYKTLKVWALSVAISSLMLGTAVIALLSAILIGYGFYKSFSLALDAWRKNISLAVVFSLALMLAHSLSFIVLKTFHENFKDFREFSVFSHSATIWLLSIVFALVIGYFAAFLNNFLVILFLESIKPFKEKPEAEKITLKQAASEPNI